MSLRQLRSYTAAISLRRFADDRKQIKLTSWAARTVSFYAAAVGQFEGDNPLLPMVEKIAFDARELEDLDIVSKARSETSDSPSAPGPRVGSFEKLVKGFSTGDSGPLRMQGVVFEGR